MAAVPGSATPATPHRIHDETARLCSVTPVSPDTCELALASAQIAAAARPGQFVNVMVPGSRFGQRTFDSEAAWRAAEPRPRPVLLRRPFSIYRAHASSGRGVPDTIELLVKVIGEGTRQLCAAPLDTEVRVLGPLGNVFSFPPQGTAVALVAGGCGWASLAMLAHELRRRDHPTYAFIGAATEESLPLRTELGRRPTSFLDALPEMCVTSRELEELGVIVGMAALEGGRLYGGLVTDLLERFLQSEHGQGACVVACGPFAMLRRVAELAAEHDAPCQLSLEKRMACGMGACMSCVCETFAEDGSMEHKRLCQDGPVLDAREINWDEELHGG